MKKSSGRLSVNVASKHIMREATDLDLTHFSFFLLYQNNRKKSEDVRFFLAL